ncbi:MAG: hypothetical protein IKB88_07555 [Clostridia bacterium]|nr:hypothetical protein [Clostridia bacterium]
MSKKNKNAQSKKNASPKNRKNIIVAASVAGVAAIVLLVIFVIAPWIKNNMGGTKQPVTHNLVTVEKQDGDTYEYVDYRGLRMPREVAEILNKAESQNAEFIKAEGAVMKIGNYEVSRPRFEMYYNYVCSEKTVESLSMDLRGQTNSTGFDYNKSPFAQNYPGSKEENFTWANKFTQDAIEDMQFYFAAFDYAIENKVQLTDSEFQRLIYEYEMVITDAKGKNQSVEEYLEKRAGKDVTYEIYAAHTIMTYYAGTVQHLELEKHKSEVSDSQIQKYYKDNLPIIRLADVRIYPIESTEVNDDIKKAVTSIRTEKEFIDFATKTTNQANYNADIATRCRWVDFTTIAETFGEDVGRWIFLEDRNAGDIALIKGTIYECLVYINKTPYESFSQQAVICEYPHIYGATEDDIATDKEYADEAQNMFIEGGKSKAAAIKLVEEGYGQNLAISIGDYSQSVTEWLFDSSRKTGDYTRIDNEDGSYFLYYLNPNPDDPDWKNVAVSSLGAEAYDKAFAERVSKKYTPEILESELVSDAWEHSYEIIKPYIEERKELAKLD